MDRFRFHNKEVINDGGLFTYRSVAAIGDQVIIIRAGVLDIEDGRILFQEMNLSVDFFNVEAYTAFVDLPRVDEAELIRLLRRHLY